MDLLSRLFIFSPMKENKKFANVITQNISELATFSDIFLIFILLLLTEK